MNREQALDILTRLKPELVKRFSVTKLALFGSIMGSRQGQAFDFVEKIKSWPLGCSEGTSLSIKNSWQ